MRTKQFKKYMSGEYAIKYITLYHLEDMTLEQRNEFRKENNPWVIWENSNFEECYTKLNELLKDDGEIDYNQM